MEVGARSGRLCALWSRGLLNRWENLLGGRRKGGGGWRCWIWLLCMRIRIEGTEEEQRGKAVVELGKGRAMFMIPRKELNGFFFLLMAFKSPYVGGGE